MSERWIVRTSLLALFLLSGIPGWKTWAADSTGLLSCSTRTIEFGSDCDLGDLFLYAPATPLKEKWIARAHGAVKVGSGQGICLKISDVGLKNLSQLKRLKPGDIQAVDVSETAITDAQLADIARIPSLECVRLESTDVTDSGLRHFASAKSLKEMVLSEAEITGPGLSHFRNLRLLSIGGCNLSDQQVVKNLNMQGLQILSVGWNPVGDPLAKYLSKSPDLMHVAMPCTKITNDGVRYLAALPKLQMLRLDNTAVDDRIFPYLQHCKQLTCLILTHTKVRGNGLSALTSLPKLEDLVLADTGINDQSLKFLPAMRSLKSVDLARTAVTDQGVKILADCHGLKRLYLAETAITDSGLKQLLRLKSLEMVSLVGTKVTPQGLSQFKRAMPRCQVVSD